MKNVMNSRQERFKKLATKRTNEVIHRLKVLGNCSNQQIYEYSEKDVQKIFSEIDRKIKETKAQFISKKNVKKFEL